MGLGGQSVSHFDDDQKVIGGYISDNKFALLLLFKI